MIGSTRAILAANCGLPDRIERVACRSTSGSTCLRCQNSFRHLRGAQLAGIVCLSTYHFQKFARGHYGGPEMLNAARVQPDLLLRASGERQALLNRLQTQATRLFPQISYSLDLGSRTANAQAFALGNDRFVRIYGGLALHPLAGKDALIFTLLHETGHHLGKGRRFAGDPALACDCVADRWALTVGIPQWTSRFGSKVDIRRALSDLTALISSLTSGNMDTMPSFAERTPRCRHGSWKARTDRLIPLEKHRTAKLDVVF
jgi:hypothetical protein